MKIALYILLAIGVIFLILSLYTYNKSGKNFKKYAGGFIVSAIVVFFLVLINTIKEQLDSRKNKIGN